MDTCRTGIGPVPVQSFHSLADPTVPYNGTAIWAGQPDVDAMWRDRNGCDGSEEVVKTVDTNMTQCLRWNCPGAPVESCAIRDMDHCWYGGRSGGFVSSCVSPEGVVDATTHMFDFWDELSGQNREARGKAR